MSEIDKLAKAVREARAVCTAAAAREEELRAQLKNAEHDTCSAVEAYERAKERLVSEAGK